MLDFTYARKSGQAVVTVYAPGKDPLILDSDHPHFNEVWAALQDPQRKGMTDEQLIDLCDVEKGIGMRFERLSERVTIQSRKVYFDGDPVDNSLAQQLMRTLKDGGDLKALVNFFEKLMTNPLEVARNELYGWVTRFGVTLDPDGNMVLFKGCEATNPPRSLNSGKARVNGEVITGRIPYPDGAVVEMPRSEVRPGPACSAGLHCSTYRFAKGFGPSLREVRVNPRDVVNVPTNAEKIRTCRLVVVGQAKLEADYRTTVKDRAPVQSEEMAAMDRAAMPRAKQPSPAKNRPESSRFEALKKKTASRGPRFAGKPERKASGAATPHLTPSPRAFAKAKTEAKARKWGLQRYMEKLGWKLIGGADPKNRTNWTK